MRYFFDTEFVEEPGHLDLISIGIVSEDGRELYLESSEVDWSRANEWVRHNVVPLLTGETVTRKEIAESILDFVGDDRRPHFWAYYADYDWVLFCWLFGRMVDLPKHFPFFCRDLKQALDDRGISGVKHMPDGTEHNALSDARWVAEVFKNHLAEDMARQEGE